MDNSKFQNWLESKSFIYPEIKDEKSEIFYLLHRNVAVDEHTYAKVFDEKKAQDLISNYFLPFMASYGYVLGQSSARFDFKDKSQINQNKIKAWREQQKNLPLFLRDFHQQKDVFKAFFNMSDEGQSFANKYPDISWVAVHCYIVDCFLWGFARSGIVLKSSRCKFPFKSMSELVELHNAKNTEQFHLLLNQMNQNRKNT